MTIPIYAYNMTLAESEFLNREFNLKLTQINSEILAKLRTHPVFAIATANPCEIENILANCELNAAIVFFFGNETYDVPQIMWLNKYADKIKYAYIYNVPRKTPYIVSFRCLIGAIYDGGFKYWEKERNIFRNFKNGIDLMRRTRRMKPNFNFSDFPQGYCNRFIYELNLANFFNGDGSIVKSAPLKFKKFDQITFVGQSGSWCRTIALRVLSKKLKSFSANITTGWGGESQGQQTSYVFEMSKCKFALTPPGNLTNRTYRYLESLIMNSLPVLPPATLQDPHYWGVYSEKIYPLKYSWKKQLKFAFKLDENSRIKLIENELLNERLKIERINTNLDKLLRIPLKMVEN